MKLLKYADKSKKKRKIGLGILGIIVLLSISLLIYKTFANFTETVEFPMMKGQVDYFGNSDVYFAFYNGNNKLDSMPLKDNSNNLVFDYGECDNGAYVEWNENEWGPLVKNLSKSKTKCSLYFKEKTSISVCNKYGSDLALCYISKLGDSDYVNMAYDHASANGVLDNNLRYIGPNPNNYISFNNEIWRIIGVMKVKSENGIYEERLKIIKVSNIDGQEDFGRYNWDNKEIPDNNWLTSNLRERLNGIYHDSLKSDAANMIDKDVVWNIGGCRTSYATTYQMYEWERGIDSGVNDYLYEWTKESDSNYHNGIGLMYVSDYSYATGGGSIGRDACFKQNLYNGLNAECVLDNWLIGDKVEWSMNYQSSNNNVVFYISKNGVDLYRKVTEIFDVEPVVYLKSSIKIELDPSENYGSIDNPFRISL